MLKEVDQNPHNMDTESTPPDLATSSHMAIHQTNLFQPHKTTVTSMAVTPNRKFLVARRGYLLPDDTKQPFSQFDIYDVSMKNRVSYQLTILEYEDITGLACLDEKRFITVSQQATINLYSLLEGARISTYTSDYGPITCMQYSLENDLLVTGTEYGYAVAYKVNPRIECVSKMVKLNEPIRAIDMHLEPRDVPVKQAAQVEEKKEKKPGRKRRPRKRKRTASSDESDNEDEDDEDIKGNPSMLDQFMATHEVTILGACANKVVAWDYHRKAILDTVICENQVCSLLALCNGDFAIGDSEGYLNIHDKSTFTCRQTERILKSNVTCLARGIFNRTLLAAGKEPVITLLKPKGPGDVKDEYILFEQVKDHSAQIEASIFVSTREFYTCSQDGKIMKFRLNKPKSPRKLKRFAILPYHQPKIHWTTNELMFIYGKSLHVHHVDSDSQFRSETVTYPTRQTLAQPPRTCSIKPALILHAATLDDKWICYSTNQGTTIIDRPGLSQLGMPSKNRHPCQVLKLCQSGRYLAAGQCKTLTIIRLNDNEKSSAVAQSEQNTADERSQTKGEVEGNHEDVGSGGDSTKRRVHTTIMSTKLKGYIRKILYHESSNLLIVAGGSGSLMISVFGLPPIGTDEGGDSSQATEDKQVELIYKTHLTCSSSSHIALNHYDKSDTNLYVYTTKDQLIRCDIQKKETFNVDLQELVGTSGLPKYTNISGFAILTRRYALLHDATHLYKLDMDSHKIVNQSATYGAINMVCDTIFDRQDEILIV